MYVEEGRNYLKAWFWFQIRLIPDRMTRMVTSHLAGEIYALKQQQVVDQQELKELRDQQKVDKMEVAELKEKLQAYEPRP